MSNRLSGMPSMLQYIIYNDCVVGWLLKGFHSDRRIGIHSMMKMQM